MSSTGISESRFSRAISHAPAAAGPGRWDQGNKPGTPERVTFTGPVPKANCGRGDHTESGLQGKTTQEERFSGDSERAYNCNLELVGEYVPRGTVPLLAGMIGEIRRVGRAG